MDFFKNISGEITRTLDSNQVEGDKDEEVDKLQHVEQSKQEKEVPTTASNLSADWGKWEETDTPTRPIATPTQLSKQSVKSTPQTTPSITPTKTSKLDSLSNEELIGRIRKQTLLLQKMKTRSEELSREVERLKKETSQSNDGHLMEELQVLKNERDNALTEVKSVKQIISATDQELKKMKESFANEIASLKEENIALKDNVQLLEREGKRREEELKQEVTSLRKEAESRDEVGVANEVLVVQLQAEVARLSGERDSLSQELLDEVTKGRVQWEGQRAELQAQWEGQRAELQAQWEGRRAELQAQWEGRRAELQAQWEGQRVELQAQWEGQREELQAHLNDAKEELGSERQMLRELKGRVQVMEDGMGGVRLEDGIDGLRRQLDVREQEIRDELTDRMEGERREIVKRMEKEREDGITEVSTALKDQQVVLSDSLELANKQNTNLQKELTELKEQMKGEGPDVGVATEQLKQELELVKNESEELKAESNRMKAESDRMKAESDRVKAESDRMKAEFEELKAESDKVKGESDRMKAEFEELKAESDKVKGEYTEEISTLQTSKASLNAQLEEVTVQLKTLHEETNKSKEAKDSRGTSSADEVKKLKAFAVKLKKELGEAKEREALLRQQSQNAVSLESERLNKQTQMQLESAQTQLREVNDKLVTREQEIKDLKEQISEESSKNILLVEEHRVRSEGATRTLREDNERLQEQLVSVREELTSANTQLEVAKGTAEEYVAEIASLKESLTNERETLTDTQQKLATLEKDAKSSSLIDLELADYQRSIEGLKGQLHDNQIAIDDLKTKVNTLTNQNEQLQHEKDDVKNDLVAKEEMSNKLKMMLRKTSKELNDNKATVADMQKVVDQMRAELEEERRGREEAKVEVAQLIAKIQDDNNQYESSYSSQRQLVASLEGRVTKLHQQLQLANEEMKRANQEHESYKVRVHSVLKQKSTTPTVNEMEAEIRHKHEKELMKSKIELKETRERLTNLLVEHDELTTEHEQLSERHQQLLTDTRNNKQQLNDRLYELEGKYGAKTRELEETVLGLRQDIVQNTKAFKDQIQELQEAHGRQVTRLQEGLGVANADLERLQQEADSLVLAKRTVATQDPISRNSSIPAKLNRLPSEERSAGEGMDIDELKSSEESEVGMVSLERLLSTSSVPVTTTVQPHQELDGKALQNQLLLSLKKTSHVTELLRESEDNCARLSDQARLLKEEIRRLERNQGRQEEASNMEYLKNVVLKFMHTDSIDERAGLVPVVTRLLKLSQPEVYFLTETVKGGKVALPDPTGASSGPGGGVANKGWGSYLHRWTGYN